MAIRIVLADDHKIMREGLRSLLEKETDFEVIAEAANGREVLEFSRTLNPAVVIMDVAMPELNGIQATQRIHQELPGIKVVALTVLKAFAAWLGGNLGTTAAAPYLKVVVDGIIVDLERWRP